jgi:hypothetical protein
VVAKIRNRESPRRATSYLRSAHFEGGVLDGQTIRFSPELNTLIGIRGSGKSSILETIRYALDIPLPQGKRAADADYKEALVRHTLSANTGTRQGDRGVNSTGEPEIPRIVWEELVVNALVHRYYFITAPIRIFVFSDRVEIISPGHLPNNLTVEKILKGNSNIRNPILASFAAKLLPYRGLGNGILRAKKAYTELGFTDDREANLFKVTVTRLGIS